MNGQILKLIFFFVFIHTTFIYGQEEFFIQRSVKLTAETSSVLDEIKLNWVADENVEKYSLYRKNLTSQDWGEALTLEDSLQTTYTDTNVTAGHQYEYRIIKHLDTLVGYGYIMSGYDILPKHHRGKLLLVVESSTHDNLTAEINKYLETVSMDGWTVDRVIVETEDSPAEVKSKIVSNHNVSPITAVLLLGNVAVPHSGNINPDAHTDHKGGWSADLYYGDIDGEWTDSLVNNNTATDPRVRNIPGDGNFDQSFIPSDIEIAVGRVDFSELPVFSESEYELTQKYIEKDIEYRSKVYIPRARAILQERNLWKGGLGQNGIRAFSPTVSADSINYLQLAQPVAYIDSYQWIFASGGGSQTSLSFWGNSETFATRELQATFTMFFGSYFGNYDYENNFMRSALASGRTLTSVWAGAPHWQYHPMGLGYDMAYCTRLTQNNRDVYRAGFFPRSVHTNLLGDPTLKHYIVSPPENLSLDNIDGNVNLTWDLSAMNVDGYYVYRKSVNEANYLLLNEVAVLNNEYIDTCRIESGRYDYLVRATKLERSPSGTFYNLSLGANAKIDVEEYQLQVGFDHNINEQVITLVDTSINADSIFWQLPDGSFSNESELNFELLEGENIFLLTGANNCQEDSILLSLFITSVNDKSDINFVSIFPNPTSDIIYLESSSKLNNVEIWDWKGKLIYNDHVNAKKEMIDLSHWSAGYYLIRVNGQNYNRVVKLK